MCMLTRSYSFCFITIFSLFLAGCGLKETVEPVKTFSGNATEISALKDKKVLVMGTISLKKLAVADMNKTIEEENAKRKAAGKSEISYVTKQQLKTTPFFMTITGQFPYMLADALRKSGVDAVTSDDADLPSFSGKKRIEMFEEIGRLGFDYVIVAGGEVSQIKDKPIFTETRHTAKNVAFGVLTFGLVPRHSSTFAVHYNRSVELVDPVAQKHSFSQTFTSNHSYDENVSSISNNYQDKYAKDVTASQQAEIADILAWLASINL